VFFSGASMGSPRRALHRIPPANTTSMVESQHDIGCFREKACAPATKHGDNYWNWYLYIFSPF